jgi:hypothetical protein
LIKEQDLKAIQAPEINFWEQWKWITLTQN